MRKTMYVILSVATLISCEGKKETKVLNLDDKSIVVKVDDVKSANTSSDYRYSGTIEASRTIPLTFQSTGIVEKVLVNAGDFVTKGQLLATTDKASSQSMYNIALAKYQQAKDAYDRLKKVHDQGSLSEIKWVEMETGLDQAKASLTMSKDNLDKCNLYAPSNGIVGKRNIEPGMSSLSISGSPIELIEIQDVYVKIAVPENEISKLKKGQQARFQVSALDNKFFAGEVTNLSPVADAISRTYEVKILVKNQTLELKPGMVCDVNVSPNGVKNCLLIPYQSVSKDENEKAFVFVVNKTSKQVQKQIIETGNYSGNSIEVRSGLSLGQTIVVEGKEKLSNNTVISF